MSEHTPGPWESEMADTRKEPCPECHEICGWCSWYRHQAREMGCGCPRYGKRRVKCEKAEELKGTTCGTCDGSRYVFVKREIVPHPDRVGVA